MKPRSLPRSLVRRLPPVARRDRRITALQTRLADMSEGWSEAPSFQGRLFASRRIREHEKELGARVPSVIAKGKFWVYDFVRSHDIDIPEQYGQWDDPADIPWQDLPDRVVIKSAFGSTSRGVFPLDRVPGGWHLATHDDPMSQEELLARIAWRVDKKRIRGPFGAEEFLAPRLPGGLPLEIKTYAFYGDVPLISLSQSHEHGRMAQARYRVIDPNGTDLVDEKTNPAIVGGRASEGSASQIDLGLPDATTAQGGRRHRVTPHDRHATAVRSCRPLRRGGPRRLRRGDSPAGWSAVVRRGPGRHDG